MIHAYAPRVSNLKSKIPDVCDRKCLEIPEAAKFGGLVWLVKVDEHGRVVTGSTPTNKNGQATLCKGGRFYFENVKTGGVFFFIAVESSSQTCGVTVGKHKDTNKTTARNKWAESGRKRRWKDAGTRCSSLGCSLTWMSDMGCRLLRRDWRWAAVAPFLLLQRCSAIHSFLSSGNRCMPKTHFVTGRARTLTCFTLCGEIKV